MLCWNDDLMPPNSRICLKTLYSNNQNKTKIKTKNMFAGLLFCECCQYDYFVAYYKRIGTEIKVKKCPGCVCCCYKF